MGASELIGNGSKKYHTFNRPTIGFIIRDNMSSFFDIPFWKSLTDTAEELDFNLITYMTHPMWYSQEGSELNDVIYQQINTGVIDGMVSFEMGLPWVSKRLGHFAKAPNVILNYPVQGYPCITLNQEGMGFAVDHLIEVHHKTQILYISGNKGNAEAEARLVGYKKSLQAHQIQINPDLVFYGNFGDPDCGEKIIKEAIEVKRLKFDAVVCASDDIAASAIRGLHKHNLSVPYDIPVTGFDDAITATSSLPPLTTVRGSMKAIMRLGAQRLVKMLNHESVPATTEVYPTELIIRQSCGCLPNTILTASSKKYKPGRGLMINIDKARVYKEMSDTLGLGSDQLQENWQKILWDSLLESLRSSDPQAFIQQLDMFQRESLKSGNTLEKWQLVLSAMRNHAVNAVSNQMVGWVPQIEDIFNQSRIFTSEMTGNDLTRLSINSEKNNSTLLETIQVLLSEFTMEGLLQVLSTVIPQNLNFPAIYMALYDGNQWPAANARLILAYSQKSGKTNLGSGGMLFPTNQILPKQFIPSGRRYHWTIAPLYLKKENLGYVVFEDGPVESLYAPLQKLIASALKGALLFHQSDELLQRVAESSQQITQTSQGLNEIVNGIREAMSQITQSMNQVASGASEQAGIVNKAVISIDQMASASQKIVSDAKTGNEYAEKAAHDARMGSDLGQATVLGMQDIKEKVDVATQKVKEMSDRSLQISAIVEVIQDITSQTNMLALNAAIEAARAGEQGRGFAVVASEVRKLAEKSSHSTKEIVLLIDTIQQSISDAVNSMETSDRQVSSGTARAGESNESMADIQKSADALYQRVKAISSAAAEIARQSNEMTSSIEEIASVSEENTAAAEEVNASVEEVNGQMDEMAILTQSLAKMALAMQELVARSTRG